MSLIGWTTWAVGAWVAGSLPPAVVLVVATACAMAFRHQQRAASQRAVSLIMVHTTMVSAPLTVMFAMLAGITFDPSCALIETTHIAGSALIATGLVTAYRIRRGALPSIVLLDSAQTTIILCKIRLPKLAEWGVLFAGVAILILKWAGLDELLHAFGAMLMLTIVGWLACGPVASWLAAAYLLNGIEKSKGIIIHLK